MSGLLALFALLGTGPVAEQATTRAIPPEAAFEVSDGWLHIRITDAGKPMPGVSVRCLIGNTVWADGETDIDGRGEFPQPSSDWCQIVFDMGAGPSAPVPLTFLRNGSVIPRSSPVRDGTAECCRVPYYPRAKEGTPSTPNAAFLECLIALGVVTATVGLFCLLILRRSSPRTDAKHSRHKHKKRSK